MSTRLPAASMRLAHQCRRTFTTAAAPFVNYPADVLSPAVAWLIASENIDPRSITGTGKAGRIQKFDVILALQKGTAKKLPAKFAEPKWVSEESAHVSYNTPRWTESGRRYRVPLPTFTPKPAVPKPAATEALPAPRPVPVAAEPVSRGRERTHTNIPLTNIRKVIASRLLQSKQTIPHQYVTEAIDMTAVTALRKSLASMVSPVPSVNDMVVRSVALALRQHPAVNAVLSKGGDYQSSATVDVSVAVATDTGLITPIVKNADHKRLSVITTEIRELATRAKQNKLKPEEFQGGSFTISNLGMFGIKQFAAIINPPQAAILAVGGSVKEVKMGMIDSADAPVTTAVVSSESCASSPAGAPAPAVNVTASVPLLSSLIMRVTLVHDVRAFDEAEAGQFLSTLKRLLENPQSML